VVQRRRHQQRTHCVLCLSHLIACGTCGVSDGIPLTLIHVNLSRHQIYGIDTEGKWNSDRVLPFPVYSDWSSVDTTRKQGFYLSAHYDDNNYIYRACYNSRPVTYTTTMIAPLDNGGDIVYDAPTQTL